MKSYFKENQLYIFLSKGMYRVLKNVTMDCNQCRQNNFLGQWTPSRNHLFAQMHPLNPFGFSSTIPSHETSSPLLGFDKYSLINSSTKHNLSAIENSIFTKK